MNRREAKTEAFLGVKVEALRWRISAARARGGMSRVNRQVSLEKACDIYEAAIAAFGDHVVLPRLEKRAMDLLIVTNILRDCG